MLSRVVELPDGSGRVETWLNGRWTPGGARLSEFFTRPEASEADLRAAGIPAEG